MSNKEGFAILSMIEAIEKIHKFSQEFSNADEFYEDKKSFDASLMNLVVIGEMILRLSEDFITKNDHIDWQKIKAFRNIIAHDYFGVDAEEVWQIIQNQLLPLKGELLKIIS